VVGVFEFQKPAFVIHDTEIMKKIAIKDFDQFQDRREFLSPEIEPLLCM
jgi:hypothetical protein